MRLPPIDSWHPVEFTRRARALDLETHKIQPGLAAPDVVCGAYAGPEGAEFLHPASAALDRLETLLRDSDAIIVNANIAYDLGCLAAARPHLLSLIIIALEQGRVFDTLVGMSLDWIARGLMDDGKLFDPRSGLLKKSSGKNAKRFSLDVCHKVLTGLDDAKDNDFWKLRYAILERAPLADWSPEAKEYPVDDARNALRHGHILVGAAPRAEYHDYYYGECTRCGAKPGCGTMCQVVAPARNLGNMTLQTRAAFAYQLGGIHGMRVDLERVKKMRVVADDLHDKAVGQFEAAGIIRGATHPDCQPVPWKGRPGKFTQPKYKGGTEDWKKLAELVALAYGTDPLSQCPTCAGARKAPLGKNGSMVDCAFCGATGLELAHSVPRTPTGWISGDRDALKESGDDLLDEYGDVSENERLRNTYLPFLEQCRVQNPGVNILLVSGRVSYYGLWQLFPRKGGVRECLVAGPGRLLGSIDFSGVEMVTLAQSMIDYGLDSPLAVALNSGQDPHCRIGARFVGVDYDQFFAKYKSGDAFYASLRQAAKPTNFGFGGGMGAVKWVLTQRKAATETVGPDGRVYKGLRVCLLLGRADVCGAVKLTEWKRKPCAPVCRICAEIAEELRTVFAEEWRMRPYFDRAGLVDKNNGGSGEVTVMPLGRVRGGCTYTQAANQPFQGRGSDMIKHAHWEVTKECYLDTRSPMYGARVPVVAHDELIPDVPEETAHEAMHRMRDVMVEAGQLFVPDVRLSAEPALMRAWLKGAEPLYDSAGRLTPWFPGASGFDAKGKAVQIRA